MKKFILISIAFALFSCDRKSEMPADDPTESPKESQTNQAKEEPKEEPEPDEVEVVALQHGSFLLKWGDLVVASDPVSAALEANEGDEPKADLIVVTHIHGDHLDPAAIKTMRKEGAPVLVPQAVADQAGEDLPEPTIIKNGETKTVLDGKVKVEAIEMYNLKRKRDNGEFFHPKGVGNGYIVTLGEKRIYISGDTECTPEMKELKGIDMAFVCMNLPYTMTPEEAAECIGEFRPRVLYPYHYKGQDPSKLNELLKDADVEIKMLDWYRGAEEEADTKSTDGSKDDADN